MLERFKKRWEIQQNWQLLFPIIGVVGLSYSAYKIALAFTKEYSMVLTLSIALVVYFVLLRLTLWIFKKLENKWVLDHKWEMIRVFIVFAITGSSSMYIGRPIIKLLGITKENLNPIIYWVLFIIIGLFFYQILLVTFGWLFGQHKFFWEFEKKMLKRLGFGKWIN